MHKGAVFSWYVLFLYVRDLSQNGLEDLPQNAFEKNTNLTYLHLDMNNLTTLKQDHFRGLANLEFLLLTSNQICDIEEGMHFHRVLQISFVQFVIPNMVVQTIL